MGGDKPSIRINKKAWVVKTKKHVKGSKETSMAIRETQ